MSRTTRPGGGPFIEAFIAPDMHMRPVGETVDLIEQAGLEVRDVHALREHYVWTVDAWYATFEANWDRVVEMVGEEVARVWRLYLVGGALAFEEGRMGVDQILMVKPTLDGTQRPAAGAHRLMTDFPLGVVPRRACRSPSSPSSSCSAAPSWSRCGWAGTPSSTSPGASASRRSRSRRSWPPRAPATGSSAASRSCSPCVWGVRLAVHIGLRSRGHGEDPRYVELLAKAPGNPQLFALRRIYLTQGVVMWFVSLPVQVAMFDPGRGQPGHLARRRRSGWSASPSRPSATCSSPGSATTRPRRARCSTPACGATPGTRTTSATPACGGACR